METTMKSLALFFCIQTLLSTLTTQLSCGRTTFQPNNQRFMQDICNQTPNPSACMQALKNDPRSPTADLKMLAKIMVDAMRDKANDGASTIRGLLGKNPPPKLKDPLSYCASQYEEIVNLDIGKAAVDLDSGNFNDAQLKTNEASGKVALCEASFSAEGQRSPITDKNNALRAASDDATAIIKKLM